MPKFTGDDLIEILRLSRQEGLSSRKISKIFGCGKSTINDFLSGNTHMDFGNPRTKNQLYLELSPVLN